MLDLIIRNARLTDNSLTDIGIAEGQIRAMQPQLRAPALSELDTREKLTMPAFVNGQLHACKSFWGRLTSQLPADIQALPRFERAHHAKKLYTAEDVFSRVDEVMQLAILHGTCAIRLFGDVDEASGVTAIAGLLQVKQKYAGILTTQVVAFPQDGVLNEHTQAKMEEGMQLGAEIVGGIPWIEPNEAAQQAHVEMCFNLAQRHNVPLHFVCDDVADPTSRTLEMVARETIKRGWQGRVCATQCTALSFYDDGYAAKVIELVKDAGISIFANSHVNLIATDFDDTQHPWPRSITRVRQLLDAGVNLCCGQDDIDNWFYPFGRNDMLEVAQFMAHNGRFAWQGEVNKVIGMVTEMPASALGLKNYGLHIGANANIVILDCKNWHEAIQFQPTKQAVILNGVVRAQTHIKQTLHLEPS